MRGGLTGSLPNADIRTLKGRFDGQRLDGRNSDGQQFDGRRLNGGDPMCGDLEFLQPLPGRNADRQPPHHQPPLPSHIGGGLLPPPPLLLLFPDAQTAAAGQVVHNTSASFTPSWRPQARPTVAGSPGTAGGVVGGPPPFAPGFPVPGISPTLSFATATSGAAVAVVSPVPPSFSLSPFDAAPGGTGGTYWGSGPGRGIGAVTQSSGGRKRSPPEQLESQFVKGRRM